MGWYRTGTVNVTNGSVDVYGTGTLFLSQIRAGQTFVGPDGKFYEIGQVVSDSHLKLNLVSPYTGTTGTGKSYSIIRVGERLSSSELLVDMANHVEYHKQLLDDQAAWHYQTGTINVYNPSTGGTDTVKTWKQIEQDMTEAGANLETGAISYGNQFDTFRDMSASILDTATWWKMADIYLGPGGYKACQIHLTVKNPFSNHGYSPDLTVEQFVVAIRRSSATQDDTVDVKINGTRSDAVRVLKVDNGNYELQFKNWQSWRHFNVEANITSTSGLTITWTQLADQVVGGETGVLYTHDGEGTLLNKFDAISANSATIYGDLVVQGNFTTVGESLVQSTGIVINSDYTGSAPTEDATIEVERGTQSNAVIKWNEGSDKWQVAAGTTTFYDMWHSGNFNPAAQTGIGSLAFTQGASLIDASGTRVDFKSTSSTINLGMRSSTALVGGITATSTYIGFADSNLSAKAWWDFGLNTFRLRGNATGASNVSKLEFLNSSNTSEGFLGTESGSTDLVLESAAKLAIDGVSGVVGRYNGSTKWEITSTGTKVTGTMNATSDIQLNGSSIDNRYLMLAGGQTITGLVTLSATTDALRLSGSTATIYMDTGDIRRITNNDGGGNWNFWSGGYYNSGEKYVNATDGAAKIEYNTDSLDGYIELKAAQKSTAAGSAITWGGELLINKTGVKVTLGEFAVGSMVKLLSNQTYAPTGVTSKTYGVIENPESGSNLAIRMRGDDTTDRMSFQTDYGSTGTFKERMVILPSTGYVGINQPTPAYELDVSGAIKTDGNFIADGATPSLVLNRTGAATDNKKVMIKPNDTALYIQAINDAGTGGGAIAYFDRSGNNITNFRMTKSGSTVWDLDSYDGTLTFTGKTYLGMSAPVDLTNTTTEYLLVGSGMYAWNGTQGASTYIGFSSGTTFDARFFTDVGSKKVKLEGNGGGWIMEIEGEQVLTTGGTQTAVELKASDKVTIGNVELVYNSTDDSLDIMAI